jgi:hypothetical protein
MVKFLISKNVVRLASRLCCFCMTLFWPFSTLFGDNWKILKPIRQQGRPKMEIFIISNFIVGGRSDKKSSEQYFINVAGSERFARVACDC